MAQRHAATTTDGDTDGDHAGCGHCVGRRTALMGLGAVGVAGLLAACGGGDDEPSTGGAPSAQPSAEATDGGSSAEATPPAEPSTPAEEPGGEALTSTDKVPVGGGVVLHVPGVVVAQPEAGTFVAYSSTCTHQGCAVTTVADGLITCDCHGSQFNVADGSVANGPAEQPLPAVAILVEGDQILAG
ncbi:ubiquinol-cytochrome c reductase iron-sulfur subunit [Jiangella sp. DSM 45060]|uniref:QcrA and Rieske domain-containing protein n=1 Tax=Jiangella sp. DSM 45060 TaxID=1798224 RepID=UPI00087D47C5|nr:Rieske (2Fe-2S) protein [Jiangella sp. DSM 45060]SDS79260.1 Rieske Fe-S protein [Jiangella sp. DSM 45060]